MSEIDTIERVIAAVKQQLEANKDKVAAMSEEEKEKYVEDLLYNEFRKAVLH